LIGEKTFGDYGGIFVMCGLSTELFLALTSFLINIGLNITILNPKIHSSFGILIGGFISILLSFLDLKYASYSSLLGVCLTSLLLIALLIAGTELPRTNYSIQSQPLFMSQTPEANRPVSGGNAYFLWGSEIWWNSFFKKNSETVLGSSFTGEIKHPNPIREYNFLVPSQIPISLGLIAFCFGGIGAFPKMYTSMRKRSSYPRVLFGAGTAVVTMYVCS
jgi:hypothetical protein